MEQIRLKGNEYSGRSVFTEVIFWADYDKEESSFVLEKSKKNERKFFFLLSSLEVEQKGGKSSFQASFLWGEKSCFQHLVTTVVDLVDLVFH